jgi:hypothetical protein
VEADRRAERCVSADAGHLPASKSTTYDRPSIRGRSRAKGNVIPDEIKLQPEQDYQCAVNEKRIDVTKNYLCGDDQALQNEEKQANPDENGAPASPWRGLRIINFPERSRLVSHAEQWRGPECLWMGTEMVRPEQQHHQHSERSDDDDKSFSRVFRHGEVGCWNETGRSSSLVFEQRATARSAKAKVKASATRAEGEFVTARTRFGLPEQDLESAPA